MLIRADARHLPLSDACVQCCVTSPPYWGLRDYGIAGQLGLESTPDAYVAQIVAVFREVRRVLKDDGTVWLNLGSSYFGGGNGGGGSFASERPGWSVYGDRHPNQSRQHRHVPAYGTDGIGLRDWTASDYACSDLCDGCLADFQSHRAALADRP
jgi:hypothetical protein